ncbi:unnamed protein product [Bursaphelenchus xylophilus]|uniref:Dihydrolipoyllysine-residue succinyltransferase component of 2-oxoglutarate dehydrogenase complex, mitochondrial n=1 Tax=Bursaphelenchus xylophilus TaxID=6326 RepID=A0A1I7RSS8_BURXY|nr:unnamed protein product [Bursaphelenchus xylophilus]CAG9122815.1 unnamed protein product [Bursaphelenchus xylophilus]
MLSRRVFLRLRNCENALKSGVRSASSLSVPHEKIYRSAHFNIQRPFVARRFIHLSAGLRGEVVEVEGPAFAESITEGDIRWIKQKGDFVEADELVAEIETDKTSVEVPAPFSGTLVELLVEDGNKVTAKQKLYKLEKGAAGSGSAAAAEPKKEETVPKKETPAAAPPPSQPKAEAPKPASSPIPSSPPPVPPTPSGPINLQPIDDIPVTPIVGLKAPADGKNAITGERSETRVKMNRMRQRIAQRLKEAQNVNAMLTTFNEIDMSNIMALRKKYQDQFVKKHGIKLGLMSPFIRASALALQDQPVVNGVIEGEEIVYRNYVDISVAVATPKGLVVPAIRNVEQMGYADIEKTLAELGKKARDNKIAIEDMQGGTFTISNGGVFGSLYGTPIINPPQSAILGMHSIKDRPIAVNGEVKIRPMMYVALTYDHRLIDGREAVLFLRKIKEAVEEPATILLDL